MVDQHRRRNLSSEGIGKLVSSTQYFSYIRVILIIFPTHDPRMICLLLSFALSVR